MTDAQKTQLYADYYPRVLGYIRSHVTNSELSEDICSDVFLKIFSNLDSFDESKASLSTWIFTVARNTLTDYYRTRRVTEEIPEMLSDGSSIEDEVCRESELETLADALERLDERSRDLIILHYYSGLTLLEVSGRLGLSYSYTKTLHAAALARLKKFF